MKCSLAKELVTLFETMTNNNFVNMVTKAIAPNEQLVFTGTDKVYTKAFADELKIKIETGEIEPIGDELCTLIDKWYEKNKGKLQEIKNDAYTDVLEWLKKNKNIKPLGGWQPPIFSTLITFLGNYSTFLGNYSFFLELLTFFGN